MRIPHDIPISILNLRMAVAEGFGANKESLINKLGIPKEVYLDPKGRASVDDALRLWDLIIEETGHESIGLECGLRARMNFLGILGYVMLNSPSMLMAIRKLSEYNRLVAAIMFEEVIVKKDKVHVLGRMQQEWQKNFNYTIDFIISAIVTLIRNGTQKEIYPSEVGFNYPEPDNTSRYEEVFNGAKIIFDLESPYLVYDFEELNVPVMGADPELFNHFIVNLDQLLGEHDRVNETTRKVKRIIAENIKVEIPSIESIARELAMSVRSLQMNLKNEGSTYKNIISDIRKDLSIQYLKDKSLNITDVAFLTGFSDIAIFSRNFKKWTGMSPSQYLQNS